MVFFQGFVSQGHASFHPAHSWVLRVLLGHSAPLALRHFALAVAKGLEGIRVPALALVRPQWLFKMARIQLPVLLVMGLMNQNPKVQMPLQLVMGLVDHSPLPHLMLLMLLALVIRKM